VPNVFYTLLYFHKPTSGYHSNPAMCFNGIYTHHISFSTPRPVSVLGPALLPDRRPSPPIHVSLSNLLRIVSSYFQAKSFPYTYRNIPNPGHSSHLPAYEDGTDSVPKRRHTNFRRRCRKHTIKYEQSVQPRSTAAASRHTGCPNDAKHTFRPVNKHAPSEQLRR